VVCPFYLFGAGGVPNPTDTYLMYARIRWTWRPMRRIQAVVHRFFRWPRLGAISPTKKHRASPNSSSRHSRTMRRSDRPGSWEFPYPLRLNFMESHPPLLIIESSKVLGFCHGIGKGISRVRERVL